MNASRRSPAGPSNVGHSVSERLKPVAQRRGEQLELVLVRYALERFLYRLSVSPHSERYLLKGALLFTVWGEAQHRPTRDADLLGFGPSDTDSVAQAMREICATEFNDGVAFNADTVVAAPIAEDKVYQGVRVTLQARVHTARVKVQIDVGFGDAVTPAPGKAAYPVLLDFPPPMLRVYPVYAVIAEKFHAMVVLGVENSRMKDFYDLQTIARRFELDGKTLALALGATFERRKTGLPKDLPIALSREFAKLSGKAAQWTAFVSKNRLPATGATLVTTQDAIKELVMPVVAALREGRAFSMVWKPGGPWKRA